VPISARSVAISPRQPQATSPTTMLPNSEINALTIDVASVVMRHVPAAFGARSSFITTRISEMATRVGRAGDVKLDEIDFPHYSCTEEGCLCLSI
jgi:hypothetical protein